MPGYKIMTEEQFNQLFSAFYDEEPQFNNKNSFNTFKEQFIADFSNPQSSDFTLIAPSSSSISKIKKTLCDNMKLLQDASGLSLDEMQKLAKIMFCLDFLSLSDSELNDFLTRFYDGKEINYKLSGADLVASYNHFLAALQHSHNPVVQSYVNGFPELTWQETAASVDYRAGSQSESHDSHLDYAIKKLDATIAAHDHIKTENMNGCLLVVKAALVLLKHYHANPHLTGTAKDDLAYIGDNLISLVDHMGNQPTKQDACFYHDGKFNKGKYKMAFKSWRTVLKEKQLCMLEDAIQLTTHRHSNMQLLGFVLMSAGLTISIIFIIAPFVPALTTNLLLHAVSQQLSLVVLPHCAALPVYAAEILVTGVAALMGGGVAGLGYAMDGGTAASGISSNLYAHFFNDNRSFDRLVNMAQKIEPTNQTKNQGYLSSSQLQQKPKI